MTIPDAKRTIAEPPAGATELGRALWASVLERYELEPNETALLKEIIRTMAFLDQLDLVIRTEGPMQDSPQGQRAHPAAVEARNHRIVLARLSAALRLPTEDEASTRRPQRRTGVRTPYAIRPA